MIGRTAEPRLRDLVEAPNHDAIERRFPPQEFALLEPDEKANIGSSAVASMALRSHGAGP